MKIKKAHYLKRGGGDNAPSFNKEAGILRGV